VPSTDGCEIVESHTKFGYLPTTRGKDKQITLIY
jgi:hypothetical protein